MAYLNVMCSVALAALPAYVSNCDVMTRYQPVWPRNVYVSVAAAV